MSRGVIKNETDFRSELVKKLKGCCGADYEILPHRNLLHSVTVNPETGAFEPQLQEGCAGLPGGKPEFQAFQTDIMIVRRNKAPRVVLELKWNPGPEPPNEPRAFHTHELLTYSTKAIRHKQICPYLRYGLVLGNRTRIGRKLFMHNSGFDFAIALSGDMKPGKIERLRQLGQRQLHCAEEPIGLQSKGSNACEFSLEVCSKSVASAAASAD